MAEFKTFRGGIHPPYHKELSSGKAIAPAPLPPELIVPLQQHIGAPNEPKVSPGDKVGVGQLIGSSEAFVSAPVHSPVSGTVKAIEEVPNFTGAKVKSIIITPDPTQPDFPAKEGGDLSSLTPEPVSYTHLTLPTIYSV